MSYLYRFILMTKKLIKISFISLLLLFIFFKVGDWIWPLDTSKLHDVSVTVEAEDGTPLRVFANSKGLWQYKTTTRDVSPLYLQALIQYEDRYFYYHPGFNPFSMARAALQNIKSGKIVSGASTLTMQVSRLLKPHARSYLGKARQLFRALQLEWHFSKNDILNMYLTLAPFGGNLQGVEAASRAYFDKQAIELSYAEAALLAVLPQSPSRFRPDRFPQKARLARDKVIKRLVDNHIWPEDILQQAGLENVAASWPKIPLHAPLLSRKLYNTFISQQQNISKDNSRIRSSIDYSLQLSVEERVQQYVSSLPHGSSAALVIVDNQNWLVKAYVGTAFFADKSRHGYVDMIQALRSPGSTLKPFIYGEAMDNGLIHSRSLLSDVPRWKSQYQPGNFSGKFHGAVSVTEALQQSLNVPAVQVLEKLSPAVFIASIRNMGLNPEIPGGHSNLAVALGGLGIKMQELVSLYGAIGRQGLVAKLRFSPDEKLSQRRLLSPQAAWISYQMLSDQNRFDRPFSSSDTGFKNNVAFKTGTSYGFRDAWAFGVTGKYTLGIWVGRPDGTPSPGQYGAVTALPLLFQITDWLDDTSSPQRPLNVTSTDICWPSGREYDEMEKDQCLIKQHALGIDGQFPATFAATADDQWNSSQLTFKLAKDSKLRLSANCTLPFIDKVVSVWPLSLEPWIAESWRRKSVIPSIDPRCLQNKMAINQQQFAIVSPEKGIVFRGINKSQQIKFPLVTLGERGKVSWYLDGKKIEKNQLTVNRDQQSIHLQLISGQHELLAIDENGAMDRVIFSSTYWD